MAAEGLPIPQGLGSEKVVGPGVSLGGVDFGASSWGKIAQAGEHLAKAGASTAELAAKERLKKEAGDNAELELKANQDYTDMQVKYDGNPDGYRQASEDYRANGAKNYTGEQQKHFLQVTARHQASGYSTLSFSKASRDRQIADQNVQSLMKSNGEAAEAAAAEGEGPGSARFDQQLKEYDAQYNIALQNGRTPPEVLKANRDAMLSRVRGNMVGSGAVRIYETPGVDETNQLNGGLRRAQKFTEDSIAELPAEHRNEARVSAQKILNSRRLRDQENIKDLVVEKEDTIKALENNVPIDHDGALKLQNELLQRGEAGHARDLDTALKSRLQIPTALTGSQRAGVQSELRGTQNADLYNRTAAATGGLLTPQWVSAVAEIESSHKSGAHDPNSSYHGLFQLSYPEFKAGGGQGSIYDPEENAKAFANLAKTKIATFQAKYNRPPTPAEFYLIHQQGEGGLDAHLRNPTAPAWQSMYSTAEGQQKGQAWAKRAIWGNVPDDLKPIFGSVENITSQQFTGLWTNRVNRGIERAGGAPTGPGAVVTPGAGTGAGGTVQSPGQVAADQETFVKNTEAAWTHKGKQLAADGLIDEKNFATYQAAAALKAQKTGDMGFLQDVLSHKAGAEILAAAPTETAARQAFLNAQIEEAKAKGVNVPSIDTTIKMVQKRWDDEDKMAKENPGLWAVRYQGAKPPEALSPEKPADLPRQLAQRAALGASAAQVRGVPLSSVLDDAEVTHFNAAMDVADANGRATLMGALVAGIRDPAQRSATMAKLQGNDTSRKVQMMAGVIQQKGDIGTATDILRGQGIADKQFDPRQQAAYEGGAGQRKGGAAAVASEGFEKDLAKTLPSTGFTVDVANADNGPIQTMREAAIALYKYKAFQANDPLYNPQRLKDAVNQVTGGMVDHNGTSVLAPTRGMNQDYFNRLVWSIGDQELANVVKPDGTPLKAADLHNSGNTRLIAFGDGKYWVQTGAPGQYAMAQSTPFDTQPPRPFVLDLSNRPVPPEWKSILGVPVGRVTGQTTGTLAAPPTMTRENAPLAEGQVTHGNIDIHNRPVVQNPDGTISTVRSITIGTDRGTVVIPTVSEDGRIMSNEEAINQFKQTRQHLGIFKTEAAANKFAQSLHEQQADEYGPNRALRFAGEGLFAEDNVGAAAAGLVEDTSTIGAIERMHHARRRAQGLAPAEDITRDFPESTNIEDRRLEQPVLPPSASGRAEQVVSDRGMAEAFGGRGLVKGSLLLGGKMIKKLLTKEDKGD